jgi:lipopolysaccharide/colanic/teichoic acid biosynthesis glycosyltransferase
MHNKQNGFYLTHGKRQLDIILSIVGILFLLPLLLMIAILIKLDSPGPAFFRQQRIGKNGKIFLIYKFRTMIKNAEELKEDYEKFNEADGPVFKIRKDPRFTRVGRFLARTGLDELPQLFNVLRGEMSFVGPRPLPIREAGKIEEKIKKLRESILPGITSSWVILGSHDLSFKKWMELDAEYVRDRKFSSDFFILLKTFKIVVSSLFNLF